MGNRFQEIQYSFELMLQLAEEHCPEELKSDLDYGKDFIKQALKERLEQEGHKWEQ